MSVSVRFVLDNVSVGLPATTCCSEVVGSDLSSCSDFSAAFLSSAFFLLDSETRLVSSLDRKVAVMVPSDCGPVHDAMSIVTVVTSGGRILGR